MLGSTMGVWNDPTEKDARLLVEFYLDKVLLEARTREQKELYLKTNGKEGEDRPLYEDREFIRIRFPGDQSSTVEREVRPEDKVRFAEQYGRFKANESHQYTGTPLSEWPAMTPAKIKMLEYHNIYTVEHMATAADTSIQKMGMDGVDLRKRAQVFLMSAKGHDADKEALKAQVAEQAKAMEAMQAQMASLAAAQAAPKAKGGRPSNADKAAREAAKSEAA